MQNMEELSPKNLINQGDEKSVILGNNLLANKISIFLFVLVVVSIASGAYFLTKKLIMEQLTSSQTETLSSTNGGEIEDINVVSDWEYYRVNNNVVYFQDMEIVGADAPTFQELGYMWAKDKNAVYQEGQKQAYLDPSTVKVFPDVYVTDKDGVWVYATGYYMRVDRTDADPATFSVIGYGYAKDKNNIYYFAQKIVNAELQSFTLLRGENYPSLEGLASDWYAKDKNNVYYRSVVIPDADVHTFVFLGNEYAKDNNKVYYEGKILENADANTFSLVDDGYAKDKSHVFYGDKMLTIEIEPASFEVVGGRAIKDSRRVYFQNYYEDRYDLATGVDALSFQHVGTCASVEISNGSYFKDKNHVFIQNFSAGNPVNSINQIDISSFQYLGNYSVAEGLPYSVSYSKDKSNVYYSCGEVLNNADVTSFTDLKDGYAKDKNKVWYLADVIDVADAITFQSIGEGYARDKTHVYFVGDFIENVDVATFTLVKGDVDINEYGSVYAKDKNYVYSGGEIVEGVSPTSCTAESIKNCNPNL